MHFRQEELALVTTLETEGSSFGDVIELLEALQQEKLTKISELSEVRLNKLCNADHRATLCLFIFSLHFLSLLVFPNPKQTACCLPNKGIK